MLDKTAMTTYKKYLILEDPQKLILSDLPFASGQKIEITISSEVENRKVLIEEMKELFKEIQALPSSQAITEEEIAAEIDAYRRGE